MEERENEGLTSEIEESNTSSIFSDYGNKIVEDTNNSEIQNIEETNNQVLEETSNDNVLDNPEIQNIDDSNIINDSQNQVIEESNLLYENKTDTEEVKQPENVITNPSFQTSPGFDNNSRYVSYEKRVARFLALFIISFAVGVILIYQSLIVKNDEYINYTEKSNLDYRVFLKENDFYEEKFLNKDMLYVASLIDYIDIDFLYNFNISDKVDLDFNYNITAVLSINDAEGKKTYLTKKYELLENKSFSLKDSQDHTIVEHITLDYDEYNKIANSFKSTYALDTTSKLAIYLNIDKKSNDDMIKELAPTSNMLIEIPLSEKSISIQMDYKDINNNSNLIKKKSISINNYILASISAVLLMIAIYAIISLFRLLGLLSPKKSKYDKYISKILRQYDRLIVTNYTCPNLKNYNIVKIKEFNELLDMRDNLKLPIMFYSILDHQKSYFYIVNHKDLYLLILKSVDFDK